MDKNLFIETGFKRYSRIKIKTILFVVILCLCNSVLLAQQRLKGHPIPDEETKKILKEAGVDVNAYERVFEENKMLSGFTEKIKSDEIIKTDDDILGATLATGTIAIISETAGKINVGIQLLGIGLDVQKLIKGNDDINDPHRAEYNNNLISFILGVGSIITYSSPVISLGFTGIQVLVRFALPDQPNIPILPDEHQFNTVIPWVLQEEYKKRYDEYIQNLKEGKIKLVRDKNGNIYMREFKTDMGRVSVISENEVRVELKKLLGTVYIHNFMGFDSGYSGDSNSKCRVAYSYSFNYTMLLRSLKGPPLIIKNGKLLEGQYDYIGKAEVILDQPKVSWYCECPNKYCVNSLKYLETRKEIDIELILHSLNGKYYGDVYYPCVTGDEDDINVKEIQYGKDISKPKSIRHLLNFTYFDFCIKDKKTITIEHNMHVKKEGVSGSYHAVGTIKLP